MFVLGLESFSIYCLLSLNTASSALSAPFGIFSPPPPRVVCHDFLHYFKVGRYNFCTSWLLCVQFRFSTSGEQLNLVEYRNHGEALGITMSGAPEVFQFWFTTGKGSFISVYEEPITSIKVPAWPSLLNVHMKIHATLKKVWVWHLWSMLETVKCVLCRCVCVCVFLFC